MRDRATTGIFDCNKSGLLQRLAVPKIGHMYGRLMYATRDFDGLSNSRPGLHPTGPMGDQYRNRGSHVRRGNITNTVAAEFRNS